MENREKVKYNSDFAMNLSVGRVRFSVFGLEVAGGFTLIPHKPRVRATSEVRGNDDVDLLELFYHEILCSWLYSSYNTSPRIPIAPSLAWPVQCLSGRSLSVVS